MPQERQFDYDYLRDLMRDNPRWTLRQLAVAITQHEREVRSDPSYPHVTVSAVASVRYRYRDAWGESGDAIPESKHSPANRTQPFANLPPEHWWDQKVQNLRVLSRLARGESSIPDRKRRLAESMARKLRDSSQVVDLDGSGKPYIRDARPDELDGEGRIISYAARYPGLTNTQWRKLETPEHRRVAADRWLREDWDGADAVTPEVAAGITELIRRSQDASLQEAKRA